MIKRSAESIANGISEKMIMSCLAEHVLNNVRLDRLDRYYRGEHDIARRKAKGKWAPNNKIVCGFPRNITDTVCGYMFGSQIQYKHGENTFELVKSVERASAEGHDAELGKDLSVFGRGIELVYMSEDVSPMPRLALIDPRSAFVVYDAGIINTPLFGVTVAECTNENGEVTEYSVTVYTAESYSVFMMKDLKGRPKLVSETPHFFGRLPIVEFWNNKEGMGDYEHVLPLIDAYDVLTSDRLNDKERFVDAILLLTGARLPEDDGESAANMLVGRILELPDGADAHYITKALNETETQVLADSIAKDIHKFSMVPDFSDERFSGNSSGVALRYKLLSLENLASTKERFFEASLNSRFELFATALALKGMRPADCNEIVPVFTRTLPINDLENAQTVSLLKGILSDEELREKV